MDRGPGADCQRTDPLSGVPVRRGTGGEFSNHGRQRPPPQRCAEPIGPCHPFRTASGGLEGSAPLAPELPGARTGYSCRGVGPLRQGSTREGPEVVGGRPSPGPRTGIRAIGSGGVGPTLESIPGSLRGWTASDPEIPATGRRIARGQHTFPGSDRNKADVQEHEPWSAGLLAHSGAIRAAEARTGIGWKHMFPAGTVESSDWWKCSMPFHPAR